MTFRDYFVLYNVNKQMFLYQLLNLYFSPCKLWSLQGLNYEFKGSKLRV